MTSAAPVAEPGTEVLQAMLQETAMQRDSFRNHTAMLSQEVVRLREKLDAYAVHSKEVEQSHTAARTQWASKLELAQREFSDMLSREDLEVMRMQLVEQTEAPWRLRVKSLEADLVAAREEADSHRLAAQRAQSASESKMHEQYAILRESEARFESEVAELRTKLEMNESLKSLHDRSDGIARTRRLQREHAEATTRCQKLIEEVDELRSENNSLLAVRSQLLGAQGAMQGENAAHARLSEAKEASLERRVAHLQHELDAAMATQERLHEAALHAESEVRSLRAQVDDAHHATATEKAGGDLKLAEAHRYVASMRAEVDRRHADALRREATLQKSRDELAQAAAASEREASAALASARDEEAARVKRLEAEKARLSEAIVQVQSDAAAHQVAMRDRADSLQGECAALKAEMHGADVAKRAAIEEAERRRRRTEEAESRLEATLGELHTLRVESTETSVHRGRLAEVEAQAAVTQEKLSMQLAFTQKELASAKAQATHDRKALEAKLKHAKKLHLKQQAAAQENDAMRSRQLEALKREVSRIRGEREALRKEARECASFVPAFGADGGASHSGAGALGSAEADGISAELRALIVSESSILEEAAYLKQQVSTMVSADGQGSGLCSSGTGGTAAVWVTTAR